MGKKTFFDVLQVSRNADPETIEVAHTSLVQRCHSEKKPDNSDSERHLKEINRAYVILSDPVKRQSYSLIGNWELCSTEPEKELYRFGTRVEMQFTDDGWHLFFSGWGFGREVLLSTFTTDGNELIFKPEKESNSPYLSSDEFEIKHPISRKKIERTTFSVRPDDTLAMLWEVQCVFKRVENLSFLIESSGSPRRFRRSY
jgi:DnaJ-class molecular chaperone